MVEVQGPAEIVIVTGTLGVGRRMATHTTEDLDWYAVDNLPPAMLPILVNWIGMTEWLAVVIDVHSGEESEQLLTAFAEIKARGYRVTVLSLETSGDVIAQRQEPNRRPLPLQYGGRPLNGIVCERRLLAGLRTFADIVINTFRFSARQLAQRVSNHSGTDATDSPSVALMSLGLKNGLPVDADIVFDVCFLTSPYWVPELRLETGLSPDVVSYALSQDTAQEFQGRMLGVIEVVAPGYLTGGRRQVTVTIGCTGGKYRSTPMIEELAIWPRGRGYGVSVLYRDLGKE